MPPPQLVSNFGTSDLFRISGFGDSGLQKDAHLHQASARASGTHLSFWHLPRGPGTSLRRELVPQGRMKIAPAFKPGAARKLNISPQGTAERPKTTAPELRCALALAHPFLRLALEPSPWNTSWPDSGYTSNTKTEQVRFRC